MRGVWRGRVMWGLVRRKGEGRVIDGGEHQGGGARPRVEVLMGCGGWAYQIYRLTLPFHSFDFFFIELPRRRIKLIITCEVHLLATIAKHQYPASSSIE